MEMKSKRNDDEMNSQFLFGSKGEILFSEDATSRHKLSEALSDTKVAFGVHDSMKFTSIDKTTNSNMATTQQNQMMQSTYQTNSKNLRFQNTSM